MILPPFSQEQVLAALNGLRMAPILEGIRGEPPVDVVALSAVTVAVGKIMFAAGSKIASLDLNPVMVGAQGEGAVVVDALIERSV